MFCKSLQETYKIVSKTAYKISCQDVLLRHLTKILARILAKTSHKILTKILPRSYKINKLLSPG